MASKEQKLPKLRHRSEFDNIIQNGQRIHISSWLMLSVAENKIGKLRCGWTIPRYVGTAVTRNRIRRWCREFFTKARTNGWDPSVDLNVVIRKSEKEFFKKISHSEFHKYLERGLRKLSAHISKSTH